MLGQLCDEPVALDCDPVPVWLPVDVDVVVVLVAAKAIPTEDNAATTEMARIEYASKLLLFPPKPNLKLISLFHLLASQSCARVISDLQERPRLVIGLS